MTAKEVLQKVKAIFTAAEPVANAFTSLNIVDGQPVYFDGETIVANIPVYLDEAMTMPYPDGTYSADGADVTFTVTAGIVTAVGAPVAAAEPAPAPVVQPVPQLTQMETEIATLKEQNAALQNKIASITAMLEKHEKTIPGLFELAEKLVEQPAADPQTLNPAQKQKFDRANDKNMKLENLAENLKKLRNAKK